MRVAAAGAALGAILVVAPSIAQAATPALSPPAGCSPQGVICIYNGTGYSGGGTIYYYSVNPDEWVGRTTKNAESLYNYRNDYRTWISNDAGGPPAGGQQACLKPGYANSDLNSWFYGNNSSITIYNNLRGVYLSSSSDSCSGWAPYEIVDTAPPITPPTGTSPTTKSTTSASALAPSGGQ
jgi:hypothetical protein